MSSPRSFLGLRRLSRGSPGAAKTAQEGSKRAARRQKMGPGDLQDGPGGFVGIPTWPERPQEWRKMLQESSQRRQEEAETATNIKIPRVLKVFGFLRFSAERATQKASEGSETAPEGTKEWPKELQRAPRGSENCSGGFPERS